MKNNTFFYSLVIALFTICLYSCDDSSEDFGQEKQTVSIKWDDWRKSVKLGDNDDDLLPDIPVLKGKASNSDGTPARAVNVELQSLPDYMLKDQSLTDSEGNFTFYDVSLGSYQIVIKQNGVVLGTSELLLE